VPECMHAGVFRVTGLCNETGRIAGRNESTFDDGWQTQNLGFSCRENQLAWSPEFPLFKFVCEVSRHRNLSIPCARFRSACHPVFVGTLFDAYLTGREIDIGRPQRAIRMIACR
jgi:hypothetical protein